MGHKARLSTKYCENLGHHRTALAGAVPRPYPCCMTSPLIITRSDPTEPPTRALLEASHALMLQLFPPEDNYTLPVDDLRADTIHFFTARRDTTVLGTGALAIRPGYGEVKSMFTAPEGRGRGVAAALLRRIEDAARAEGLMLLRLETGAALAAAVRLYERHGFTRCARFGDYAENANSLYMQKHLIA